MIDESRAADQTIHLSAIRAARRCRETLRAVLPEEYWQEADWQFYLIIREEMERSRAGG